ncbi:MAG: L-threonylcarbamoyladenylate synthase [Verrucomicrobiota bacterium]
MAQILQPTEENLRQMRKFLRLGGLVSIPTETVYGLAANALDASACLKIFEAKNRPANDPLICHVSGFEVLDQFCEPNETARQLAAAFWPGPLSIILPKKPTIPNEVTSGLPSVAVRSPKHPVFRQLIEEDIDFPLAAPSANPFAYISPTRAAHVKASLDDKIEYVLDGGPCEFGLESTIIDLRNEAKPTILRHGALPQEDIEEALGKEIDAVSITKDASTPAVAPGTLPKHYSPKTQLYLVPTGTLENHEADNQTALLHLIRPAHQAPHNYYLSESGQLSQIASNLFATLRDLDAKGYSEILTEEAPEIGLGQAINDRLRRASSK